MLVYLAIFATAHACVPPNCDRPDFGTCGNACCRLLFPFPGKTDIAVAMSINSTMANGGPDGRYFIYPLAEGPVGFVDIRSLNRTDSFLGQTTHTTAKRTYNDTINVLISRGSEGTTVAKAHSISQIGGAYTDMGQNFKNIVTLMFSVQSALGVPQNYSHADSSCPEP